ncbi:ABC transporter ATP-binding protein [Phyllobacterium endophyticum]|uniref:ABC transporter ATP-binding protein n=1 Tax=Phyllobacterium endophyticum TaxID=1149773 RepID=A0A2P7AK71_9HYPH|nr:ABC transporter ATP-binding protein [Phyllobacterium endophyticum]MBB3237179.1 branched-chain amino acid transport system ATP-binding protein [Phyllobacterium endophyticum]PSH54604.1 ABC transporter ATP-binding protein [Phyllobacterium endophyticum]TYR40628.1 ABC transporter ATP-binding protein [Phyllobacterium endophyticum]
MLSAIENNVANQPALLEVQGLSARYGKRAVLSDIDIRLAPGEIVAVLGHNGAGKTTLLHSIMGMHDERSGGIFYHGKDISRRPYYKNASDGISLTPADAPVFRPLSVEANLRLGTYSTSPKDIDDRLEAIYATFPHLKDRRLQLAGTLSGGEQRMLAVSMAVMNKPRVMLLDEPSIGLAPATADMLMSEISLVSKSLGTSVLIVDQNVRGALRVSSRVYFLRMGRIILEEPAEVSAQREHYWDLF